MNPLSDFSPGIDGMDIGISPAAPAGERGQPGGERGPGAWTRLFGMGLRLLPDL